MNTKDIINLDQLIEIGYQFSKLGVAIAEASAQNTRLFDDALDSLRTLQSMTDSMASENVDSIKSSVEAHATYAPQITQMYMNSFLRTDEVFKSLNESIKHFKDSMSGSGKSTDILDRPSISGRMSEAKRAEKEHKSNLIKQEMRSLSNSVKGWANKLKIPLPGAVLAGMGIWMAMGFKRKQRVAAEAGEIKNIIVAATDATVKGVVGTATHYLSGLQERLQKQYGIARSDFQGVVQSFVEGGIKIESVLDRIGSGMGEAGKNTLLFTYSLDKMFELPGGTSAKRMVQMMAEYGYTLDEARQSLTNMMLAGRESGIGMTQFMKNVMDAGGELKRFGFNLDAVSDLTLTLQKNFEAMGVPTQFAGRQAALGIKQMASGLVNMSMDWQLYIAERLGYGPGLAGRQEMISAQQRVAREGGYEELMEWFKGLATIAMELAGGDEVMARQILEQPMGLGFEGAIAAINILKAINSGDIVSAKKLAQDKEKDLRSSLQTEKEKRNAWELQMNNWMDAVSMIGEGLMSFAAQILAHVVVFGKAIPTLIINYLTGKNKENEGILKNIDTFLSTLKFDTSGLSRGFNKLGDVAEQMGLNILGDNIKSLKSAWNFDPLARKEDGKKQPLEPVMPVSPFIGSGGSSAPIIQTITVPVNEPGTYPVQNALSDGSMPSAGGIPGQYQGWVGGQLSIISEGVDAVGNIKLTLVGNCPQCGLMFGSQGFNYEGYAARSGFGYVTEERRRRDLESMARMLASEVGTGRLKSGDSSIMKEAEGIAWTAVNRMKEGFGKGKAPTIEDVITKGAGYGKQGTKRLYSTAREATPESYAIAQKVLSGESQDPTQGSTFFFHETGQGYGPDGSLALPHFAQDPFLANKVNINQARFYGRGGKDAPDKEMRDERLRDRHRTKQAIGSSTHEGMTGSRHELVGEGEEWSVPPEFGEFRE